MSNTDETELDDKTELTLTKLVDSIISCMNAFERFANEASIYVEMKTARYKEAEHKEIVMCDECEEAAAVYRTQWEADLCVACYKDVTNGAPLPDKETYPPAPASTPPQP